MEEEMLFRGHLWLGLKEAETSHGGGFSCRTWAERARERKLPSEMLQIHHGFYAEHGYRLAAFSWCRFVLTTLHMPSHFLQPWILLCIKFLGVCGRRVPCMKNASSSNFGFKRPNFGFRQTDGRTDGQTDAINIFWAFLVKYEVRNSHSECLSTHILARKKSETENGHRFDMTKMMLRRFIFPN